MKYDEIFKVVILMSQVIDWYGETSDTNQP